MIDAYAGIGTIGLSIAKDVRHVYGMEVVEEAVADANKNAEINGIENATYLVGKPKKTMKQWEKAEIAADVVFVDPPRKGLEASFIEATCEMKPKKVIYISCNPATMARDPRVIQRKRLKRKLSNPLTYSHKRTMWRQWHCLRGRSRESLISRDL